MSVDMELYKVFHCVAENKSISKAANALYVSQPAISRAIQKLESQLDCTLFIRSSRGVVLSKEGEVLYGHVSKALNEISIGEDLIEKLKATELGTIRVGVSNLLCKHLLIPYLKSFHQTFPQIKFAVINNTTHETLKLLNKGAIDFGIVSSPSDLNHYTFTPLLDIHDIFVAKSDLYPELNKTTTINELSKYPIMLLEPDNITRQYLDRFLLHSDMVLRPEIEMGSMEFLIEFAKIGLGIAAVLKEFVQKDLETGELIEIPLKASPPGRPVGIVTHKDIPVSMASQKFIDYIQTNSKS